MRGVEKATAGSSHKHCSGIEGYVTPPHSQTTPCSETRSCPGAAQNTVYDICSEAWFHADNSRVSIQLICINENSAQDYAHLRVIPSTV